MSGDTMLERAARALCAANGIDPDGMFDYQFEPQWKRVLPLVKAALEAIREPSEDMIAAASQCDSIIIDTDTLKVEDVLPSPLWIAMIDAILQEKA